MKIQALFGDKNRLLDWLLAFQAAAVVLFLSHSGRLELADFTASGDAPSYLSFPFSPISEALASHRTFGFPLIVRAYRLLSDDLRFWPHFQLLSYLLSILFLHRSLIQTGFTRLAAFAVATGLFWTPGVYGGLKHVETETFAAVFTLLAVSFLLRAASAKSRKTLAMVGISVFLLYQIRPNLAFVAFLIPVWGYAMAKLLYLNPPRRARMLSLKLFNICVLPLLAFCLFRYAVVGDFGLVSLSGTTLAGLATARLNDQNITVFQGETRALAEEILRRKRRLSPPCNKPGELTHEEQHHCGSTYVMVAWLAGIKHQLGLEPFEDPEKNHEPWRHKNLSGFFSINNAKIDSLLKGYSMEILPQEKRALVIRLGHEYFEAIRFYVGLLFCHLVYASALFLALTTFGITKLLLTNRTVDKVRLKKRNNEIAFFGIVTATMVVSGVLSSAMLVHLYDRYLMTFSLLLLSLLLLYALPPPLVSEKRRHDD